MSPPSGALRPQLILFGGGGAYNEAARLLAGVSLTDCYVKIVKERKTSCARSSSSTWRVKSPITCATSRSCASTL
jgi:hypothetical protein